MYLRTYGEDMRCDTTRLDGPRGRDMHRHVAAARASMTAWRVQRQTEACKSDLSENIPCLLRLVRQKSSRHTSET